MEKKRICYLVSSLCNEGPVNVMYNIIKNIDFLKFEVSIITFVPEKETTRMDDFSKLPISIYQLSKNKFLNPISLYLRLRDTVNEIEPNVLHAHCPRSLYLMAFLPKKFIKVFTIHNYPNEFQIVLYGKIKGEIVILLDHIFTRWIKNGICCAPNIREDYLTNKGWDFKCIPNGSSMPVWKYNDDEKSKYRKEFGLKEGMKYFIFISRFSQEKNPDIIINAFRLLDRSDIGLVMLGKGPMWDELKKQESANIILPGFSNRVYDYIIASDFYISASNTEGLANTLLESMSVGLPMLLSDIPSHRAVMNMLGDDTGILYNQHNQKELLEGITRILEFDSLKASENIQYIYTKEFTSEVMSKRYQEEYINLL